jgi:4-amino-4-deoxy-L-arabinose transferase-like glycosyltransferase
MTAIEFARRARNLFERLFDALVDPARCERAMAALLAGYAVTWSLYGAVAHSSYDTHFDMGEMFAWSHEVGLSAPPHPPLGAWLVRGWFTLMPVEPWAYYMFGVVLATVALWIAWRICGRYISAEKRALGIVLLTFVPFYNFHAFRFNASSVLTPFWAATTWWFLRSLETRRAGWAVLAGIGAAASMLGKYWSLFLLAGLAISAMTDPRRSAYFRSPAPWLTIASGAAVLAPHLAWVMTHGSTTFAFALTSHKTTLAVAAQSALGFLAGALGYIAAPIVFGILATAPGAAAISDTLWPANSERRTIVVAFAAPLLLAALTAVLLRDELVSLWAISAMTLLPVVLLSSPLLTVIRGAAVRLLALAVGFPLVMAAVSPVVAIVIHREGRPNYQSHYRLIARAVERAWQARTGAPLRIVGSYRAVVDGTAFYFPSRPSTFTMDDPARTPWVDENRIKRDGIAIVCPEPETVCVQKMNAYAARYGAKAESVILARQYFGTFDTPVRYQIVIIPPQ